MSGTGSDEMDTASRAASTGQDTSDLSKARRVLEGVGVTSLAGSQHQHQHQHQAGSEVTEELIECVFRFARVKCTHPSFDAADELDSLLDWELGKGHVSDLPPQVLMNAIEIVLQREVYPNSETKKQRVKINLGLVLDELRRTEDGAMPEDSNGKSSTPSAPLEPLENRLVVSTAEEGPAPSPLATQEASPLLFPESAEGMASKGVRPHSPPSSPPDPKMQKVNVERVLDVLNSLLSDLPASFVYTKQLEEGTMQHLFSQGTALLDALAPKWTELGSWGSGLLVVVKNNSGLERALALFPLGIQRGEAFTLNPGAFNELEVNTALLSPATHSEYLVRPLITGATKINLNGTTNAIGLVLMPLFEGTLGGGMTQKAAPVFGAVAIAAVSGLAAMHEHGMLHQDPSGDKLFVDERGNVRVGGYFKAMVLPRNAEHPATWYPPQLAFSAPEALLLTPPSLAGGVYGFGSMLLNLFFGLDSKTALALAQVDEGQEENVEQYKLLKKVYFPDDTSSKALDGWELLNALLTCKGIEPDKEKCAAVNHYHLDKWLLPALNWEAKHRPTAAEMLESLRANVAPEEGCQQHLLKALQEVKQNAGGKHVEGVVGDVPADVPAGVQQAVQPFDQDPSNGETKEGAEKCGFQEEEEYEGEEEDGSDCLSHVSSLSSD